MPKKYIVKFLPCEEPVREKDFISDNGRDIVICESIDYKLRVLTHSRSKGYFFPLDGYKNMKRFLCTKEDIKEGDEVVVAFTNGALINPKETGEFIFGILTKKWEDEPYCMIDEKNVDLASEGHSSNVYKVFCQIYGKDWVKAGDEFEDSEVNLTASYEYKKNKELEVGDNIKFIPDKMFGTYGKIKEINPKYPDAAEWEDEFFITDVKEMYDILDGEPQYRSLEDRKVTRRDVVFFSTKLEYDCEIKCPICKHFH